MKKLLTFFFITFFILTYYSHNNQQDCFYDYFSLFGGEFSYFMAKNSDYYDCIKVGDKYMYSFSSLSNSNKLIDSVYKQVTLSCLKCDFNKILDDLNIKIFFKNKYDDNVIFFGYSNKFEKFCFVKNQKINFQFVFDENNLIIGYPMIYGSY